MARSVTVRIEVPRFGFVKRKSDGTIDIVAPLPSPFNYGSIPGTRADDGDPIDVLVLGPRLSIGTQLTVPVRAGVRFVDADRDDPKLIASDRPLTACDRRQVSAFFTVYAQFKRVVYALRGTGAGARFEGWLADDEVAALIE